MAEERRQPRFSQFALTSARDTSAFETKAVLPGAASPADNASEPVPVTPGEAETSDDETRPTATSGELKAAVKAPSGAKPNTAPQLKAEEELVSFTVRLPASLYMRMRRSLGLREKLGELCVAAITRELDLRR